MSCKECDDRQRILVSDIIVDESNEYDVSSFFLVYYLRVANGNVAVVCCEKHFEMLRNAWRKYLKEQD